MFAKVKSEQFNVSSSSIKSAVLRDKKKGVDAAGPVTSSSSSESSWLEEFPKRWVIVVLCFSAFLLCNMDRVFCFFSFNNICIFFL